MQRRLKFARIGLIGSLVIYLVALAVDAAQVGVDPGLIFWISVLATAGICIGAALCVAFWVAGLGKRKRNAPQP
jgi:hypothetical protein